MKIVLICLVISGCASKQIEYSTSYVVTPSRVECDFEIEGKHAKTRKVYEDHLRTCGRAAEEVGD